MGVKWLTTSKKLKRKRQNGHRWAKGDNRAVLRRRCPKSCGNSPVAEILVTGARKCPLLALQPRPSQKPASNFNGDSFSAR